MMFYHCFERVNLIILQFSFCFRTKELPLLKGGGFFFMFCFFILVTYICNFTLLPYKFWFAVSVYDSNQRCHLLTCIHNMNLNPFVGFGLNKNDFIYKWVGNKSNDFSTPFLPLCLYCIVCFIRIEYRRLYNNLELLSIFQAVLTRWIQARSKCQLELGTATWILQT